jgi:DNA polymerase-3 subunit alpha
MAIVVLDDGKGSIEAVVYNEIFDSVRNLIREDELVVVQARITPRMTDDGQQQGLRVVAERIFDLAGIRKERARGLRIACNGGAQAARLFELLSPFRNGECPIVIDYRNQGLRGEILLPDTWRVVPDEALLVQLKEWLTAENVRVVY